MQKFNAWDKQEKHYYEDVGILPNDCKVDFEISGKGIFINPNCDRFDILPYIGLKDCKIKEYYVGDIFEFDNGDRGIIRMEDWLEMYIEWIGEPECSDQARDIYRIEKAEIIGNQYENPELLEAKA